MDTSQTPNSNGKTAKNKSYFWTFLSPIKFWAVYGYWFCLIFYTYFLGSMGLLGPSITFPESLCPFDSGCSHYVYLFFFTLPTFFLILMGIVVWLAIKKNNKIFLITGIIHIALIILLTDFVNDITTVIVWASR